MCDHEGGEAGEARGTEVGDGDAGGGLWMWQGITWGRRAGARWRRRSYTTPRLRSLSLGVSKGGGWVLGSVGERDGQFGTKGVGKGGAGYGGVGMYAYVNV